MVTALPDVPCGKWGNIPNHQKKKKKKSKPILIRIFPTRTIKHQVLGSPLIGRDLLMGFDILHQIPNLRWSLKGLSHIHLPLKKNEDVNPTKSNH